MNAFADDKTYVAEKERICLRKVENIVGKGENAAYQQFPPFPTMFSKSCFTRVVKSRNRVVCFKSVL